MLAAIGPGRYRATRAATSSKLVGCSDRISARIGAPSSWNTPMPDPRWSISSVIGSSSGMASMSKSGARSASQHRHGVGDDVEVAQAEEVHLQQAELLDAVHLVLRDDRRQRRVLAALRLALHRQVLGQRLLGDHDRGGVDAVGALQPLEALGDVDDLLDVGVGVVHRPQLGRRLVAVGVLRVLLEAVLERRVAAHHERRHGLGDAVADVVREAEHPGRVAHGVAGLDRAERDDLGDVVAAVALGGVADHLVPVAGVEVHVDVGHRERGSG